MSSALNRQLARLVSFFKRTAVRSLLYYPADFLKQFRSPGSILPPRTLYKGGGNFIVRGKKFRRHFIELGNLQPHSRVLDVGSGAGRMAIPLTEYLREGGEYWGLDIVKKRIEWCQRQISSKFPHFHFIHANIYNKHFNPRGTVQPEDFRFPFEDNFFDLIFLVSVFTHMLPGSVENYLSEIARTLKPTGRCFITFFLLNDESENQIRAGNAHHTFPFPYGACRVHSFETPETEIAYPEQLVINLFEKYNLEVIPPIHYGSWSGRPDFLDNQDIIIAKKL